MSTYEKERGEYLLPASEVASFRRGMVTAMNRHREKVYEAAQALHAYLTEPIQRPGGKPARRERLAELNKAIKDRSWRVSELLYEALDKIDPMPRGYSFREPKWDQHVRDEAINMVLPWREGQPRKLQAPKKKDLPPLPANTTSFHMGEAHVFIDPKTRRVEWSVAENNHSVSRARESLLGQVFFSQLNNVKWTRQTGGFLRYTNEYMRDAAWESGADAVDTRNHKGPLGEKQREYEMGPLMPSRRRMRR